jgi:hypothetical protein
MNLSRSLRRGVVLAALLALAAPLAVAAGNGKGGYDRGTAASSTPPTPQQITGLPVGVSIKGIDFRPAVMVAICLATLVAAPSRAAPAAA